jgi:uncharacterized damage-inducible protein DinB
MSQDLKFPIGPFQYMGNLNDAQRAGFIQKIAETPQRLREAVAALTPEQLDTPYRPGGWTARQVVHHLPDSHMNAYIRFKLALTEEYPIIKPYDEGRWAELADVQQAPVETSLQLLAALHERWVLFLRSLSGADWARTFVHPERGVMTADELLALYAWHGPHHVGHIASIRTRPPAGG